MHEKLKAIRKLVGQAISEAESKGAMDAADKCKQALSAIDELIVEPKLSSDRKNYPVVGRWSAPPPAPESLDSKPQEGRHGKESE